MQSVPIPVSHSLISHFFPRMISFKLLDCLLVILLALCVSATESFSNSCESVVTFTGDSISTSVNEDQPYSCSDSIPSEVAAYCVCNGGVKVHGVASGHEPFTCNEACSTTNPMTISKWLVKGFTPYPYNPSTTQMMTGLPLNQVLYDTVDLSFNAASSAPPGFSPSQNFVIYLHTMIYAETAGTYIISAMWDDTIDIYVDDYETPLYTSTQCT